MLQLAIALIGFWLLMVALVLVIRAALTRPRTRRRSRSLKFSGLSNKRSSHKSASYPLVRTSTRHSLMVLLNGDRKAANRLLQQARCRHPGKSETWYWEKVIYDLRRDRRV